MMGRCLYQLVRSSVQNAGPLRDDPESSRSEQDSCFASSRARHPRASRRRVREPVTYMDSCSRSHHADHDPFVARKKQELGVRAQGPRRTT